MRLLFPLLLTGICAFADTPLHPKFLLLDAQGREVVESGEPVSTMKTCGECHDTEYIESHSYHSAVGFDERDTRPGAHEWDLSPGMFGRWDVLRYRRLTVSGEESFDLGVAEWIRAFGDRHVGGGPALRSRTGKLLSSLDPGDAVDPETHVLAGGRPVPWDWKASGAVEMNCFLCHLRNPADNRRIEALKSGRFRWAATATLANTGLVERTERGGWGYVRRRFTADGEVIQDAIGITNPRSANCGICHGIVHSGPEPLQTTRGLKSWETESKGQVYSAQRISESSLNLLGKATLSRPWDIHAARLLNCIDCHHSLNNPASFFEASRSRPRHLAFDARRMSLSDYLERPSHHFAKGESAQGNVARRLDGTMRRCEDCHAAEAIHAEWLPNPKRHLQTLLCETCHIPQVYATARKQTDWTVLTRSGEPRVEYRGIEGDPADPAALITGFEPVILPRYQKNGKVRHGPHNLSTSWYWVGGDPPRPVRQVELSAAFFGKDGRYHLDLLDALGVDGSGTLSTLDSAAKVEAVRERLEAVGVADPRIEGSIQPLSLHHNVAAADFATRRCESCHTTDSRMTRPFEISSYVPAGATAQVVPDSNTRMPGRLYRAEDGRLLYEPVPTASGRYVIGRDRAGWIDILGALLVIGTVAGACFHGTTRFLAARKRGS
ncbi:MAG: hypothetical protein ACYSX0_12880 [Planctomycetota bacterium]